MIAVAVCLLGLLVFLNIKWTYSIYHSLRRTGDRLVTVENALMAALMTNITGPLNQNDPNEPDV